MKSLNKWFGIGRLGRDAEQSFTAAGKSVTKFSVATEYSYKKGEEWVTDTNWTNCTQWNAEKLAPYLLKGTQISVEGRLRNYSYDDKDGKKVYAMEVVVENVILLGGNNNTQRATNTESGSNADPEGVPF